jgi:hypothetical protein
MRAQRPGESALLLLDTIDSLARSNVENRVRVHRVDFIVGLKGLDAGAYSRTIEIPFRGEPLRISGVEDFIAMKLFAHGPQALADARSALDAAGDNLDLPLLRRLAERFGQETARALDAALPAR